MSSSKSFTLIEVTLATFILAVGVVGVFSLVQMIFSLTSSVSNQLTALYLAQEGIENVRNIRDSNWLEQRYLPGTPWDDGIVTGDWQTIDNLERKTTITKPEADKIVVSVEVKWTGRGGLGSVTAETELYNWR